MAEFTGQQIINTPYAVYDKEAAYDALIAPLISHLVAECKRLEIPLVLAACLSQTNVGDIMLAKSGAMAGGPAVVPATFMAAKSLLSGDLAHTLDVMQVGQMRAAAQAQRLASAVH